jgi:ParB family chromosome partitioning protein
MRNALAEPPTTGDIAPTYEAQRLSLAAEIVRPAPHAVAHPKTGPGSMLQMLSGLGVQQADYERLQSLEAAWATAFPSRPLDPSLVDDSKFANRIDESFVGKAWDEFKATIAVKGGNVQPVAVRPKADGRFELVFGHRRTRACRELNLQVLAMVLDKSLSDDELFVAMDHENRHREDLSPYERGRFYLSAMEMKLYPSLRQLAAKIGVPHPVVIRYAALASLPEEVLELFPSKLGMQVRWGDDLSAACKADRDGVLARASQAKREKLDSPRQIVEFLVAKPRRDGEVLKVTRGDGSEIGSVRRKGKVGFVIDLADKAIDEPVLARIQKAIANAIIKAA